MEGPVVFDLWGVVSVERKLEAVDVLAQLRQQARSVILREIVAHAGAPLLLSEGLGWQAAKSSRDAWQGLFTCIEVFQSGYGPADRARLHTCQIHSTIYGGVLGCPVCGGRSA